MGNIGMVVSFIVSLIAIASAFGGLVAKFTQLKTNYDNLEKRVNEQSENIKELYDSRNETNKTLVQLATILNSLVDQNKSIERKIDELRDKISTK